MSEITQNITEYTGDVPDKETMTPDAFDAAAEDWVAYQDGLASELNTFASQANAVGVSANDLVSALAAANFKGAWSSLAGALAQPACVLHGGQYWMLLTDLADVTVSAPADTNTDWVLYPTGVSIVAHTSNHAVTAAEMRAGNVIFTNSGATVEVAFQLPARNGDYKAAFIVDAGQYLKVTAPSGESIYFYNNQSTAASGYVRSNTRKTYWEIVGSTAMNYTIINLQGDLKADE